MLANFRVTRGFDGGEGGNFSFNILVNVAPPDKHGLRDGEKKKQNNAPAVLFTSCTFSQNRSFIQLRRNEFHSNTKKKNTQK